MISRDTSILMLDVAQRSTDALLQVHPHRIRHVLADRRVNEWRVPRRSPCNADFTILDAPPDRP
jgi:hypothetical protein